VKKILIVESDPAIAASLEARLQVNNYHVIVSQDAVQGTSFAVKFRPDAIILDISLPAGNGFALAKQFKKLPETADIPVLAITASTDAQLREQAMTLHLAGFFEKPYEIEELLAVIDTVLERRLRETRQSPALAFCRRTGDASGMLKAKKILVVEDDAKIAMALALRLKAAGYETVLAFDALLGLSKAVKISPDLVLLDITMPAGDGLELARNIRNNLPQPPPFIFLTASKQEGLRGKALELGAAGFFEKPYEAEELVTAIENIFHRDSAQTTMTA